jgi:hypothetical protein
MNHISLFMLHYAASLIKGHNLESKGNKNGYQLQISKLIYLLN